MEASATYIHTSKVHNTTSSDIVVPILMKLFKPTSVLDVGCGIGTWLSSFAANGVGNVWGVDGDFVDRELLKQYLKEDSFIPHDLTKSFSLDRSFDLVLSLEVAEHLQAGSADIFIESLCKHGDTIIFSAAIPGQGGQNHVNEQWKLYWIDKFNKNGFEFYDILRPLIWNLEDVEWWYKQNMVVFSCKDMEDMVPSTSLPLEAVHPGLFKQHLDHIIYLQQYVKELEMKVYSDSD